MATERLQNSQAPAQEQVRAPIRTRRGAQGLRLRLLAGLLVLLVSACGQRPVNPTLETLAGPTFTVRRAGSTYTAESGTTTYSGTLKSVVQSAANELTRLGGGTVGFGAGDYDLGADNFEFYDVTDVAFIGQGIDVTSLRNSSDAAKDTEPFDCTRCDRLTIRNMTVSAGGSLRSTSDALDFDGGDDILIDSVKVTEARGRGIVFDGKGNPAAGLGTADRNVVRNCVIMGGVPSDGISLLASNNNRVENCQITDVGGTGIYATKASATTDQPNKPSNDNVISGNRIENAGRNGIAVNSGNRNLITGNTVLNSSDNTAGLDGIRLSSTDGVACNDNRVESNTATDNQTPKTQRYGLHISSANCNRTVVGSNTFAGNLTGTIRDVGTGTVYNTPTDTVAPTRPTSLRATAVSAQQVNLSWTASTDNVGVTGYEIFRGGGLIATLGNVTTYADTSAQPATTYSYQVRAVDAAGNRSSLSTAASATTPSSGPTDLTFTPVADTYVKSDAPNTNYGTSTSLHTDGSPAEHILLKFSVAGVGTGRITRAVLRLHNTNASGSGGDLYPVADSSWSETSVTWNSAPAAGTTRIASLGRVAVGTWYEVVVTPVVSRDGLSSFKITSPSTDGAWYASRQGGVGLAPQLVVTVSP